MKNLLLILLFLPSFISAQNEVEQIDQYLKQAQVDWNIPGIAVAIVKDGKQVLAEGYGVRGASRKDAVDANTLFAIASNTKAFTSAAIATLVEDGKLNWDDKVVDHLPYFKLYDPYVTAEFTVADLLCHRSGLGTFSGDLLWYGSDLSREEVIRNAAELEPVTGFREGYGYQNIMFMAAGEVIESVTDMAWDEYIRKEFLGPLEMNNTLSSTSQLKNQPNHAEPHNEVDGKQVEIDWVNWDNMGPAGSFISSVNDLSNWMILQLGQGTQDDKEYWTQEHSQLMWTVHTPKQLSQWHRTNFPSKHFSGYGLGWDLFDYHGRLIVNHGGGYDGFISQTILVPEEDLGIVILTNSNNFFPYAMMYHILDIYLAPEQAQDWGAYMLELKKQGAIRDAEHAEEELASRVKGTSPSLSLDDYVGEYHDPKYGSVIISKEKNGLKFDFQPTDLYYGSLSHWHYDTFKMTWGEQHFLPEGKATFILNEEGQVEELRVRCPNPDLYFYELELMRVPAEPEED
jgi:CubicO group peptidase (beta-lactamase class C family)